MKPSFPPPLRTTALAAIVCCSLSLVPDVAAAQSVAWIRQFGTSQQDFPTAALADGADGVFVVGLTNGDLGAVNKGPSDVVVARFDGAGQPLWLRQIGTTASEAARAAALDGTSGLFVAGETAGAFGGRNAGLDDAWLTRIDASGRVLWRRQFGSGAEDEAWSAAPDGSSGVFIAGLTRAGLAGPYVGGPSDCWAARYDGSGNRIWTLQIGTAEQDFNNAAAPDGDGGAYLCGWTDGDLGGPNKGDSDAWVMRVDRDGNVRWTRQIGTGKNDVALAAAPDGAGGVFVGGRTDGDIGIGSGNAWIGRIDGSGATLWLQQFGDHATQVLSLGSVGGDLFAAGSTLDDFGGPPVGQEDVWFGLFDETGENQWLSKIGSVSGEQPRGIVRGRQGGVIVTGYTQGMLGAPPLGALDFWVARIDPP